VLKAAGVCSWIYHHYQRYTLEGVRWHDDSSNFQL
jgi:hypothetical protein